MFFLHEASLISVLPGIGSVWILCCMGKIEAYMESLEGFKERGQEY